MARGGARGLPRHLLGGRPTRPDELIHLNYEANGEISDAIIEDFCTIERMANGSIKITLVGVDEAKPVMLIIESKSKITMRPFGVTVDDEV